MLVRVTFSTNDTLTIFKYYFISHNKFLIAFASLSPSSRLENFYLP
uniref:Uncharacterized protein LOC107419395 n=1 Tax=Rhizophora mucronata TaxID=61149 RepID=A0A2P2NJ30_RHIMU